jgi:hypothetical protein
MYVRVEIASMQSSGADFIIYFIIYNFLTYA